MRPCGASMAPNCQDAPGPSDCRAAAEEEGAGGGPAAVPRLRHQRLCAVDLAVQLRHQHERAGHPAPADHLVQQRYPLRAGVLPLFSIFWEIYLCMCVFG